MYLKQFSGACHLMLIVTLGCSGTYAQSASIYASIVGTVSDPSGAAVPDGSVTVTNENTNISNRAKTNGEGFLPLGTAHSRHLPNSSGKGRFQNVREHGRAGLGSADRARESEPRGGH